MTSLNPRIFAKLNMGAAQDFDDINTLSLSNNFAAQVGNNFKQVASEIQLGMAPQ